MRDRGADLIPRVIHRIWLGGKMPDDFVRYGETWAKCHPAWAMRLWNETNIPRLVNDSLYENAPKIAPRSVEQFRADVIRYELLLEHGGLYVDADFECKRSFAELIGAANLVAAWEVDDVWVNNALLGASPGHPFIRALVRNLPASVKRNAGKPPNHLSGPRFLTKLYRQLQPNALLLPSAIAYPYLWSELERGGEDFPDAYAVHHWNNKRRQLRAIG